jgi:hypothetical protein
MKYCIAACDRFIKIDDPYKHNRICFEIKHKLLERYDLIRISEDPKFAFIANNIVYFYE